MPDEKLFVYSSWAASSGIQLPLLIIWNSTHAVMPYLWKIVVLLMFQRILMIFSMSYAIIMIIIQNHNRNVHAACTWHEDEDIFLQFFSWRRLKMTLIIIMSRIMWWSWWITMLFAILCSLTWLFAVKKSAQAQLLTSRQANKKWL